MHGLLKDDRVTPRLPSIERKETDRKSTLMQKSRMINFEIDAYQDQVTIMTKNSQCSSLGEDYTMLDTINEDSKQDDEITSVEEISHAVLRNT